MPRERRPGDRPPGRGPGGIGDDGLRALGEQVAGRRPGPAAPRSERRLQALGDQVARAGTPRARRGPGGGRGGGSGPGGGGSGHRGGRPAGSGRGGGRRLGRRWRTWSTRRKILVPLGVVVVLVLVLVGALYGYASYRFSQLPKVAVAGEVPVASGQPFNMLVIGSDSRLGQGAGSQFGTANAVTGQRSDVIMVWHVVPATKQITITSIPRDTMVQMVGANVAAFGHYNRINAAYNSGPSLLVQTIEANFGIPISHLVEVNFGGFEGAVNALGGVWMDFPYPARDVWSGLNVTTPGCQLLNGQQALAVARSRHYQYLVNGVWQYTPIGDLGRIQRQGAFLKALVDAAKSKLNPLAINAFLGSLPSGLLVDDQFSVNEVLHLALAFHSITPGTMVTQTLPTVTRGFVTPWGDVLFVNPQADHQMLATTFGGALSHATSPPPDLTLVPVTVAATSTVAAHRRGVLASWSVGGTRAVTASATPSLAAAPSPGSSPTPSFDPTACKP